MNLYLIGYRGCGKSTVAPLVAERLGWNCVDADDWIESASEMTIAAIFSKWGEAEFRRRETNAIAEIAKAPDTIVSLGGGAPVTEENRKLISNSGKTAWLRAAPETLWQRISADAMSAQRRPDLTEFGGLAEVELLLASRCPAYERCAEYTIDVDDLNPEEIAERIVDWFCRDDTMI